MLKNCIRSCDSTLESQPVLQQFSDQNCQFLSSGFADRSEVDGNSSIVGRQIASDHEQEWRASGVDVMIARLNVQTLVDTVVDNCTHEVVYPIAERLNWNVIRFGPESRPHLRGWWVSGVDPLDNWQAMSWGRFKPDAATPVMDPAKGKAAKYLSPSLGKGSSRLVLLDVPLRIWQRVAARYNLPIDRTNVRNGFWYCFEVWRAHRSDRRREKSRGPANGGLCGDCAAGDFWRPSPGNQPADSRIGDVCHAGPDVSDLF
jgi:hypothetical protein